MLHTIENEQLAVTVSELGAELQSILGADGTQYLWQGDPKYWKDRALNIFPYVARLTQGSYDLDGQRFHMNIHGFAWTSRFQLESQEPERLVFLLTDNADTYKAYPRRFQLRIIYTLTENRLDITYSVRNADTRIMYFGIGGHPGFNVPLKQGLRFSDYTLRFEEPCRPTRVGFTQQCYLSGEDTPYPLEQDRLIPLEHSLFDEDAIVLRQMSRRVTLETQKDSHAVVVDYPQLAYLGIWHAPKTDAPYVCIEPWSSLPSKQDRVAVLEQQEDLLSLQPGEETEIRWSITLY